MMALSYVQNNKPIQLYAVILLLSPGLLMISLLQQIAITWRRTSLRGLQKVMRGVHEDCLERSKSELIIESFSPCACSL
jgi:hypothetical protein